MTKFFPHADKIYVQYCGNKLTGEFPIAETSHIIILSIHLVAVGSIVHPSQSHRHTVGYRHTGTHKVHTAQGGTDIALDSQLRI